MVAVLRPKECLVTFIFISSTFAGRLAVGWNYVSRERGPRATALLDLSHIKIIVAILIMYFVLLPAVAAAPPSHTFCSLLLGTLVLFCQEKLPEIGRQIFADSPPLRESSCSLPRLYNAESTRVEEIARTGYFNIFYSNIVVTSRSFSTNSLKTFQRYPTVTNV